MGVEKVVAWESAGATADTALSDSDGPAGPGQSRPVATTPHDGTGFLVEALLVKDGVLEEFSNA